MDQDGLAATMKAAKPGAREDVQLSEQIPIDRARLRRVVAQHYGFVWRSLRRLGVAEPVAEDAVQKVLWVAVRKIGPVPVESERGFLFAVALRVAAAERRNRRRHPDVAGPEQAPEMADPRPTPDELTDRRKARDVLDHMIAKLPMDLRAVFVLSEIEELTAPQIAELLGLPLGTVASRLRRARSLFDAAVSRYGRVPCKEQLHDRR